MSGQRVRVYQCADCGKLQRIPRRTYAQWGILCKCGAIAGMRDAYRQSRLELPTDDVPTSKSLRE